MKFGVRGRGLGTAVIQAQQLVARRVMLPLGYGPEWVGECGSLQEALYQLAAAVPGAICLIVLLLNLNLGRVREVALAASVIPMATVGGVLAPFITATPFSVTTAIGFIALCGISVMDGILMLAYFKTHVQAGPPRAQALRRMREVQMQPVLMACAHDLRGCVRRPAAGGAVHGHRLSGAKIESTAGDEVAVDIAKCRVAQRPPP